MNKNEQWANEVLHSLDGMQKATPKVDLFDKIMTQLPQEKKAKIIPLRKLRWAAVAASIIIGVNVYVFSSGMNQAGQNTATTATEYQLVTDYSLYD